MLPCEWIEGCAPPPRGPQQLSSCAGYVAPEVVLTRRRPVNGLTVIQLYAWHWRRDFRFEPITSVGPSRIAPIAAPQIQRVAVEMSGRSSGHPAQVLRLHRLLLKPLAAGKTHGDKSESPRPPQRNRSYLMGTRVPTAAVH